jgi:hypothetical protein
MMRICLNGLGNGFKRIKNTDNPLSEEINKEAYKIHF